MRQTSLGHWETLHTECENVLGFLCRRFLQSGENVAARRRGDRLGVDDDLHVLVHFGLIRLLGHHLLGVFDGFVVFFLQFFLLLLLLFLNLLLFFAQFLLLRFAAHISCGCGGNQER